MPPPYSYTIVFPNIKIQYSIMAPSSMLWDQLGITGDDLLGTIVWVDEPPYIVRRFVEENLIQDYYKNEKSPLRLNCSFPDKDVSTYLMELDTAAKGLIRSLSHDAYL